MAKKYKGNDIEGLDNTSRSNVIADIENNEFVEDSTVDVVIDPSKWAVNMGIIGTSAKQAESARNRQRVLKLADEIIEWLQTEDGQEVYSLIEIKTRWNITERQWQWWNENYEEFVDKSEFIRQAIAARIHKGGITNKLNPIFSIFSLKNQYSEEFKDKQEVDNTFTRVDVIQIKGGTEEEVKQLIEENKKKLNE